MNAPHLHPVIREARFQPPDTDKPTRGPAYAELEREFFDAFTSDPARHVRTPEWSQRSESVANVIYDAFAGNEGDQLLINTLRIVALATKSSDSALSKIATLFGKKIAATYAAFHCDALALSLEDAE